MRNHTLAIPAVAVLVAMAGCGACEPDHSTPAEASAPSAANAPPASTGSHAQPPRPPPPAPKLACRAIAVDGDVHLATGSGTDAGADAGTTAVLLQGLVPTEAWVDVAKGGRLVAKDPRTARETTFRGAARVRACVGFTEESWLASGVFESSVGAGETPGAEEWVITPFGVVRYTAAKVAVDVKPRQADVALESGSAFTWAPGTAAAPAGDAGSTEEGWTRLAAGRSTLAGARGEGAVDGAKLAVDRCNTLATSAHGLAVQVLMPGGADAGTIAAQVTTRRLARAACAVASLRVGALPEGEAAPLRRPLADAVAAWSNVPVGSP
jgi:hypothetical protein